MAKLSLDGKKTYIVATVVALVTFAKVAGLIDEATFGTILAFLGALGLYSVREAVGKIERGLK